MHLVGFRSTKYPSVLPHAVYIFSSPSSRWTGEKDPPLHFSTSHPFMRASEMLSRCMAADPSHEKFKASPETLCLDPSRDTVILFLKLREIGDLSDEPMKPSRL